MTSMREVGARTVPGDDEAREVARPVFLDRTRHGCRRLAGTDHQGAAVRRRRQEGRHPLLRQCRRNRRIEERAQKSLGFERRIPHSAQRTRKKDFRKSRRAEPGAGSAV
jgi:hypothetical protein